MRREAAALAIAQRLGHFLPVKILLVEDEKEIADFVRDGLGEQGFSVDHSADGEEGLELATTRSYDAIVLDIMLPGQDGLSILKALREEQDNVPVVIITARGETEERIEGLNLGADDYLPKPFYMDELIARLRAVWRRAGGGGGDNSNVLTVADLTREPDGARGAPRRRAHRHDAEGVFAAGLPDALAGARADAGADPRGGVGLPLQPRHQPRRRLHPAAAQQDRHGGQGAADPHAARGGLQDGRGGLSHDRAIEAIAVVPRAPDPRLRGALRRGLC